MAQNVNGLQTPPPGPPPTSPPGLIQQHGSPLVNPYADSPPLFNLNLAGNPFALGGPEETPPGQQAHQWHQGLGACRDLSFDFNSVADIK